MSFEALIEDVLLAHLLWVGSRFVRRMGSQASRWWTYNMENDMYLHWRDD